MRRKASLLVLCTALIFCWTPAAVAKQHSAPFRVIVVDSLTGARFRQLARLGAVGLLVPGVGPTVNRRQALAALVRGAEVNAHLGGVAVGPRLLSASHASGVLPTFSDAVIVVSLPPRGPPRRNDRRYPVVVIGHGFHGILESRTTRIDGLVSIVDIAPTALGRARASLFSAVRADAVSALASLDRQIHTNNRLKLPVLIVVALAVGLLAFIRARAAFTAVLAALLVNVTLGAAGVASEPLVLGALIVGTVGGGLLLAHAVPNEGRLLALIVAVLGLHLLLFSVRPAWLALTPLGPTQNSRFWGVGNQLETLLLAPLVIGAHISGRRFGRAGFAAFALLAILLVADNRFGSDGGGAVVFGVTLAFLGARIFALGKRGFVTLLLLATALVLGLVSFNLRAPGPDHLRSAFSHGFAGLLAVAENRVPLAYLPTLRDWPFVLPLAMWFCCALVVAFRTARSRAARDLVTAVGLAISVSLLVNDSAAYELAGGVAALAAVMRSTPIVGTRYSPSFAPLSYPRPLPSELTRDSLTPGA